MLYEIFLISCEMILWWHTIVHLMCDFFRTMDMRREDIFLIMMQCVRED